MFAFCGVATFSPAGFRFEFPLFGRAHQYTRSAHLSKRLEPALLSRALSRVVSFRLVAPVRAPFELGQRLLRCRGETLVGGRPRMLGSRARSLSRRRGVNHAVDVLTGSAHAIRPVNVLAQNTFRQVAEPTGAPISFALARLFGPYPFASFSYRWTPRLSSWPSRLLLL